MEELDLQYLSSFSQGEKQAWGYWFKNPTLANYYDANHAHILTPVSNKEADELPQRIINYYQAFDSRPVAYIYQPEQQSHLLTTLETMGFLLDEGEEVLQACSLAEVKSTELPEDLMIQAVTKNNQALMLNLLAEFTEFGGRELQQKVFTLQQSLPEFHYFLLLKAETPIGIAGLFLNKYAQVENIVLTPEQRRKGFSQLLLNQLKQVAQSAGYDQLFISPSNEIAQKSYQKNGFQTVAATKAAYAFYQTGRTS